VNASSCLAGSMTIAQGQKSVAAICLVEVVGVLAGLLHQSFDGRIRHSQFDTLKPDMKEWAPFIETQSKIGPAAEDADLRACASVCLSRF
jgi:Tfp pilus assembly protein PilE